MLGALALFVVRGRARQLLSLLLPALSLIHLLGMPDGHELTLRVFDYTLTPIRIDKLSLVWGYIFHIAALISAIYALHEKDPVQSASGAAYAGSAIAAAFAGDLLTLFVFWEFTAITSVFLIWARRTPRSGSVGVRYLVIQVASGVILLAGTILRVAETGSLEFGRLGVETTSGKIILLAFAIKAAFPLLHNWLQDSYPEATVVGSVVLSAFTTKLAIYALARAYPGTSLLIPIGVTMTLFPIVYAVIENDLRRVLAYSLNNQLGYMVVGVGIGTELSINGTAAHAFAHIIYKGLLFMCMGAVLHRAGTIKASELGGLYKSMPWTTAFCIVGSLSISGFPLFSGFVTKSMTLTAVAEGHFVVYSLALLVASAGVVDHSGIKIPFFAFFAHDSGLRVKEAPRNMLVAMALASAICIGLGVYPAPLYAILPYPVDYVPYTWDHVQSSLELLLFAALAFVALWRLKLYPPELKAINLDSDWLYRAGAGRLLSSVGRLTGTLAGDLRAYERTGLGRLLYRVRKLNRPPGALGEPWSTGTTSLCAAAMLCVCLLVYYWR
jgi:multicomponent Na+:H+ antiporter subunit D